MTMALTAHALPMTRITQAPSSCTVVLLIPPPMSTRSARVFRNTDGGASTPDYRILAARIGSAICGEEIRKPSFRCEFPETRKEISTTSS